MSGQEIDTYSSGTVAVTSGSTTVVGTGTNWTTSNSAGIYSILKGHVFICGTFWCPIKDVVDGTHIVLYAPFAGATAGGQAYEIIRYSWVETAAAVGTLQKQLNKGTKAQPVTRWDIDDSTMSLSLRSNGAGKPAIWGGASGAADGAQAKILEVDPATGIVLFNSLQSTGPINAGTLRWEYLGVPNSGAYAAIIDYGGHPTLHIGGAFNSDSSQRWLGLFGTTYVGGNLGVNTANTQASLHVVGNIRLESASPNFQMWSPTAATDEKYWDFNFDAVNHAIQFRALNDAYSAATVALTFTRVGYNVNAVFVGAGMAPAADNTFSLGIPSSRWGTVYAATGTINTSDARLKTLRPATSDTPAGRISDLELDAFGRAMPHIFQMNDAIAEKGENARFHIGYIVQEIIAEYEAVGLDPFRYAPICRDMVTEKITVKVDGEVQASETVESTHIEVETVDGVTRAVQKTRTETRLRFATVPVVDATGQPVNGYDGNPLMHSVPVMVPGQVDKVTEGEPVERLALRYEQCLVLRAAWLERENARNKARITALEAAVAALQSAA